MRKTKLFSYVLLAAAWLMGGSAQAWDEPAQDANGVYQIGTASELEWFAEYVNSASTDNTAMLSAQAVLTANIDMTGVTHTPIGASLDFKYAGKFDGQFHTISNLVIDRPDDEALGLFGVVRGNAKIKNIIMDATCSIKGKNRIGSIIGLIHENTGASDGLEILNCVSYATLTTTSGAAGMIGAGADQYPYFDMENCVNAGRIDAVNKGTAFCGWNRSAGGNAKMWNCLNIAEISVLDGGNQLFRGVNRSIANCYDTYHSASNFQGEHPAYTTEDPLHSGEICYLLNTALRSDLVPSANPNAHPFTQDLSDPNSIPLPIPGKTVYQVADLNCDGTPKGSVSYSNTDGGSTRDPHQFDSATGFCTVCGAINEEFVAKSEDGFYHLSTVGQVEWFSHMVRDKYHGAMNVKLDADIDFGGVADAHLPIGSNGHKFFGHFDGQGHRIKGMVLTTESKLNDRAYDGNGFFGSVRGGGTDADGTVTNEVIIENLIIDASCSVEHDNNFAAGVVAHINSRNDNDSHIIIRYCGNEANVSSTGKNIAGILGCVEGTEVGLTIMQCYNTGNIYGGNGESAAICGWAGTAKDYLIKEASGCWNIGEVTGIDGNGYNLFRVGKLNNELYPAPVNCIDLCTTNGGNQGKVTINTEDPVASGELCYLLNGDQSNITWTQTLGEEEMPNMWGTSSQVYQAGTVNCAGASVGGLTYNNVSGETIQLDHNINPDWGMCDVCHTQFQEPALVDGWYELKNAGNVEWFSAKVAAGDLTINGKLMNDIDFYSIENLHSPIGPSTGQKFNGTFDGQGYRIKNMIINRPSDNNIGFFGFLRGNNANTTVKNLIIDSSCSISANNRVGGITGSYQNGGNTITLENVVNEATIHAKGQDAGGLIGGHESGGPTIIIKNCMNVGDVTSDHEDAYVGALCCYMEVGGGSKIENFLNLGTIGTHKGGNIGRHNIGDVTNLIDLSDTENKTQGVVADLTVDDVENGKVAYILSWYQELGEDDYPMPFAKEGATVYRTGYERCDGADIAETVYSNTDGTIVTNDHDYNGTTGLCDNCGFPNADFKSLVDGAYELNSVIDVQWFAAMVNYGNPAINGNLTADLDFDGNNCRIGNGTYSYSGTFQGNDHVVSNFVVNNSESVQGFFGWVTGGADISGIIFDNTCSVSCTAKGGIVGGARAGGTVKLTRLGNEGNVTTVNENAAGIIGTDDGGSCVLLIDQCYSTGSIKGGRESAQIAGWTGNNSVISNSWSCAEVEGVQTGREFSRYGGDNHDAQYVNCFTTYNETNNGLTYNTPMADFESGKVAYTINKTAGKDIFRQTLGTGGDAHPVLLSTHGIVNYISSAGYTTQYIPSTDVTIPTGVEAYAGVVSGSAVSLRVIETAISKEDAVVLKGSEGYYSFVPTTGVTAATENDLLGSDGNVTGGDGIYALSKQSDIIGFYPVSSSIKIPAGKAYLEYPGSGVKVFTFVFDDDTTGIENLNVNDNLNGAIYNVAGQRLNKMQKGINIVNGKKIAIK